MNAKELVLNEFHSLIWFCHKNDYDSRKAEQHFYRFRGILWALRETGQISEEYRYLMSMNARKAFMKAEKKHKGE